MFMSFSESSYNSDHGSGNEDGRDGGFAGFEESSDEVDFLAVWNKYLVRQGLKFLVTKRIR